MRKPSPSMGQTRGASRSRGGRPLYPRVLMVCEGSETEPNYLEDLRKRWHIPNVVWKVLPSALGTGPEKVVQHAKNLAREKQAWDEVYCIFDRDDHEHYKAALVQSRDLDRTMKVLDSDEKAVFRAIPSVPCFELWFLLHFRDVTRESHQDEIGHLLKAILPEYEKATPGMLATTLPSLAAAYARADKARKRSTESGNDNPSTDMDLLVRRLFEIGEMKKSQ
ncbi:MAG: RloB family protein [Spirochaetota bacterium]